MNKNWENTIVKAIGTLKIVDGKIDFTYHEQFKKYSTTLKVEDDNHWASLARKTTFIVIDGITPKWVDDLNALKDEGQINEKTRLVFEGHLVRSPGKPGQNDFFNLKTRRILPAEDGENAVINLEEALTKGEWQIIRDEHNAQVRGTVAAPAAPVAPTAPF